MAVMFSRQRQDWQKKQLKGVWGLQHNTLPFFIDGIEYSTI